MTHCLSETENSSDLNIPIEIPLITTNTEVKLKFSQPKHKVDIILFLRQLKIY